MYIYWFTKYTKNTPSIKDADLLYKRPLLFSLPKLSFGPSQLHGSHQQVILDFYFDTLCMPLGEPAQGRQQDPSGRPAEERDSTKVSCDVNLKRRKQHKP